MSIEDIIRMAEAAGGFKNVYDSHPPKYGPMMLHDGELERFAALVAAAEREECAKVAETIQEFGLNVATAIRARGQA